MVFVLRNDVNNTWDLGMQFLINYFSEVFIGYLLFTIKDHYDLILSQDVLLLLKIHLCTYICL